MSTSTRTAYTAAFCLFPPHASPFRQNNRPHCILALCLCALFIACLPLRAGALEQTKGRASWYGTTAHGKQTASGEIYNRNALTAAHRQLPFGSVVKVNNLKNGRHVLVRINDRGPFVKGRVVDVSRRAADLLRMTDSGVVPVSLEMVGNTRGEPLNKNNAFFVHVADVAGAMQTRERMTKLGDRLKMPFRAVLRERSGVQSFAVCTGPYDTFQEAQRVFLSLEKKNVSLKGIVEAPAADNIFPLLTAEAYEIAIEANHNGAYLPAFEKFDNLVALVKNSLQIIPSLSLQSGIITLTVVRNALPALSEGIPFLTLPYQGHSGYTYFPS